MRICFAFTCCLIVFAGCSQTDNETSGSVEEVSSEGAVSEDEQVDDSSRQAELKAELTSDTESRPTRDGLKTLTSTGDNIEIVDVNSYFSATAHGPTTNLINIKDENVVVRIRIERVNDETKIEGTVNIFKRSDGPNIAKWINNQHSDGIYADAPKPVTHVLGDELLTIESETFVDSSTERDGRNYLVYEIVYRINDHVLDGEYRVSDFSNKTRVWEPTASSAIPPEL